MGHSGALLAALILADELQELMDKEVGQHPLATGIGGMEGTRWREAVYVDLKEELLQLGLDTNGLKAELVRRLAETRRGEEGAQDGPQRTQ